MTIECEVHRFIARSLPEIWISATRKKGRRTSSGPFPKSKTNLEREFQTELNRASPA